MRIGIDLVEVGAIERSMADFGARFTRRLFGVRELQASTVEGRLDAHALAVRFAAKEATIKAFDLSEAGIGWDEIEVVVEAGGEASGDVAAADGLPPPTHTPARVRLHGRAAESVARQGSYEIAASLSREGDLACAIVAASPSAAAAANGREEGSAPRSDEDTRPGRQPERVGALHA